MEEKVTGGAAEELASDLAAPWTLIPSENAVWSGKSENRVDARTKTKSAVLKLNNGEHAVNYDAAVYSGI